MILYKAVFSISNQLEEPDVYSCDGCFKDWAD